MFHQTPVATRLIKIIHKCETITDYRYDRNEVDIVVKKAIFAIKQYWYFFSFLNKIYVVTTH